MIPPFILITILSLFVFYCIKVMIKRGDDLHAMAFFTLFLYTIFAQIGYAYFPELSILIGAYFGPTLFYNYWVFMFFSLVFTFLIYRKTSPLNDVKYLYRVKLTKRRYGQYIFFIITFFLYLALNLYFYKNRELFAWGDGNPMGSQWFALGFGIFTICTLFTYIIYRNKSTKFITLRWSLILFIIYLSFFLKINFAAGSRSNILYFFFAIIFYELSPIMHTIKYQKKRILKSILIGAFIINALMILSSLREKTSEVTLSSLLNFKGETNSADDNALSNKILLQDYYVPSHLLFISMHYKFIDPIETLKSNFANVFIKLNHPYLTQTITSKIGLNYKRGEGWGYHLFVEGYNAVGWLGIIYNAIFWNLGMAFWCTLARSDNKLHNKAILSVLIFILVGQMRSGQTCGFIHTYWLILLPALVLLLLATNSKMVFLKNTKNE